MRFINLSFVVDNDNLTNEDLEDNLSHLLSCTDGIFHQIVEVADGGLVAILDCSVRDATEAEVAIHKEQVE